MGFSVGWTAVRQNSAEELRTQYGLEGTGEFEPFPESGIVAAALANGWYVVFFNDLSNELAFDFRVHESVSRGGELVNCLVEEHVMFMCCTHWVDGTQQSEVSYDDSRQPNPLSERGTFQDGYAALKEGSDGSDLPVEYARSLAGFRHDMDTELADPRGFEVMRIVPREPATPPQPASNPPPPPPASESKGNLGWILLAVGVVVFILRFCSH